MLVPGFSEKKTLATLASWRFKNDLIWCSRIVYNELPAVLVPGFSEMKILAALASWRFKMI